MTTLAQCLQDKYCTYNNVLTTDPFISKYVGYFTVFFAVAGLNHGMTKIKQIPYSKYDSTSFSSVGNVVTYPKKEKIYIKKKGDICIISDITL